MSNINLGGFDIIVHLAESAINRGLELLPSGSTFPIQERRNITLTALGVPLPIAGNQDVPLIYDAFVELERPEVTLDQANNRVIVNCDLSPASQLTFLRTSLPADASLLTAVVPQIAVAGSVQLVCPFGVADLSTVWGGQAVSGRAAVARAGNVVASLSLVVPSADGAGNVVVAAAANGLTAVQITSAAIQTALQAALGTSIGNKVGDLPLTTPVRLNAGPTPVQTVSNVFARIAPSGPPAISLGVLTALPHASPPTGPTTIPGPPAALNQAGAIIGAANYWVLHLVTTGLRAAHPAMVFTVNENPPSASFNGAVVVEGGEEPIKIRRMDITVNPAGGLLVDGFATASGGCWDADIDFDFSFTFTCDPNTGTVVPLASEPNVDVDVDKDWLCIIVGIVVGAIGGALVGVVIGAIAGGPWGALIGGIIGGVVGGIGGFLVADFLIDPLDLDGVSLDSISVLGGLPLPLPVGGAGLLVQTCDFDDLALAGNLVYVDLAERHRSGSVQLPVGAGFDLDGGIVRHNIAGVEDDIADLLWTGTALQTLPGATLGPVFASDSNAFFTLSLTELEGFPYAAGSASFLGLGQGLVVAGAVPMMLPPGSGRELGAFDLPTAELPPRRTGWIAFALRTDEGRYAKCRARRNRGGTLALEYVVYARPRACLGSVLTLETLSKTVVDSGVEICTDVRTEQPLPPLPPFKPIVDVIAPDVRLIAGFERDARDMQQPPVFAKELASFDRGDVLLPFPPKRPPTSPCGTHITIEHKQADWQVVDRQQLAILQALPSGVVAPLKYRWNVFGTDLPAGSGTTGIGQIVVAYDENSPVITLTADEGEDLAGSIVVNAVDADGRKLRATRHINSPSRQRTGGCCRKTPVRLPLRDALLQLNEARTAQRIVTAGLSRLQQLAATGRVEPREAVTVAEAVSQLRKRKVPGGGGKNVKRARTVRTRRR